MRSHVCTSEAGCQLMFDGIIKTDTHIQGKKILQMMVELIYCC